MSETKFLIVDDSATMRRIIGNSLKRLKYRNYVEAANGVEALEKLGEESFDAIITDWNMPEMSGLDFTKKVRSTDKLKTIPILMVTTRGLKEDVIDAMKAGVSNYVVKPFTPTVLKEKLDKILK
ncbi:MAG: response regulator [Candidatus Cloacimonadota bacterium]|nr:response regulator [Candidatus Cloacimonadota bacterium]